MMRGVLRLLEWHTPGLIISMEIRILYHLTANCFGVSGKRLRARCPKEALEEYAAFTVECMQRRKADPRRLYREAYRLGARIRRLIGFTEREDLERLIFYLYKNIRIQMDGQLPGEVTVDGCYFSRFYSPGQCAMMSHVDAGIITGIMGGGSFAFTKRLTEGCSCCRACLSAEVETQNS